MGSPFASLNVSGSIPLPFDDGQWIKVRKLTGRQFERAQMSHRDQFAAGSNRAWSQIFRRMLEGGASDPQVLSALADPLTGFDRYVLAREGLVEWSYPQALRPIAKEGEAAALDPVDDLDDEAVDFIAREVLKATKPGLFLQTEADGEAAQKKE